MQQRDNLDRRDMVRKIDSKGDFRSCDLNGLKKEEGVRTERHQGSC